MTKMNWGRRSSGNTIGPRNPQSGYGGKVSKSTSNSTIGRERVIDMMCAKYNYKLWSDRAEEKVANGLDASEEQKLASKYLSRINGMIEYAHRS